MLSTGNRRRSLLIFLGVFLFLLFASSRHQRVRSYIPTGFTYSTDMSSSRIIVTQTIDRDYELPPQEGMTGGSLPGPGPSYSKYITDEKGLPQHNLDLKFPEGRDGRYVKFSSQIRALGWNNVLNEVYVLSFLPPSLIRIAAVRYSK